MGDKLLCKHETMNDINEGLQQDILEQKAQVKAKDNALKDINKLYKQEQQHVKVIEAKISDQTEIMVALRKELDDLIANKSEISPFIIEKKRLQEELEMFREEIEHQKEELHKSNIKAEHSSEVLCELQSDKEKLEEDNNELRNAFQDLNGKYVNQKSELDMAMEKYKEVHLQYVEKEKLNKMKEKENSVLQKKIKQLEEAISKEKDNYHSENKTLKLKLNEKKNQIFIQEMEEIKEKIKKIMMRKLFLILKNFKISRIKKYIFRSLWN